MLFAPFLSSAHHGPCGQLNAASSHGDSGSGGRSDALRKDDRAAMGSCLTADAATMASSSGTAEAPAGAQRGFTWAPVGPPYPAAVEGVAMKAALATTVRMEPRALLTGKTRMEPRGLLPGNTGARVGLLDGLRSADMDTYDEVR